MLTSLINYDLPDSDDPRLSHCEKYVGGREVSDPKTVQHSRSIGLNATEGSVLSDFKEANAFAAPGGLHLCYEAIPRRTVYAFVSLYTFQPDMFIVYEFAPLSIPNGIRLRLEDPTSTNIKLTSAKFRSSNE